MNGLKQIFKRGRRYKITDDLFSDGEGRTLSEKLWGKNNRKNVENQWEMMNEE